MPSWRKLITSGSDAYLNSLNVATNVTASFFTGSFVGDGSGLTNLNIFPYTGSAEITGSLAVIGPVEATTVQADVFIGNQVLAGDTVIPSNTNGFTAGEEISIAGSVTVGSGSTFTLLDFNIPNLQEVTNVGSTTTKSITAANFITTSDRRLKTDIAEISEPFEVLNNIKAYEYNKDNKKEAGFIAQEVQEVLPYAVFENDNGNLTMSDRPVLAYLYAAVMELKKQNEDLKGELQVLKNKVF